MNIIIGWFLIIIAISVFLTFVLGYDLDLKDKIICVVSVDAFVIFAHGCCISDSWVEQEAQMEYIYNDVQESLGIGGVVLKGEQNEWTN